MGYELNQLMKLYGVSTPTVNTYSGASKPTDFADANFEQKMKNYDIDTAAYKKYQGDYDSRLAGASIYDMPQFQPKATATTVAKVPPTALTNPIYTTNPAYYKDLVTDRYKTILNTAQPDVKGLAYWSQQLASGAISPSQFDAALLDASKVKTDTTTGTTTGTNTGTTTETTTGTTTGTTGTNTGTTTGTNTGTTTGGGGLNDIAKMYTPVDDYYGRYQDQFGSQYTRDEDTLEYKPYIDSGIDFSHGGSVKGYSRGGPENRQSTGDQGGLLTLADIYGLENPTDLPYIEMPMQMASAPTNVVSDAPKVPARAEPIRPTVASPPDDGPQMSAEQILENMERRSAVTTARPPVQPTSPDAAPADEGAVAASGAGRRRPPSREYMEELYRNYAGPKTDYSGRIQAASEKSRADTEAFRALLEKSMVSEKENAPSKAEMYFRLAAAFGAPSKTGNIFENVSMAAKELGEFSKDTTAAKRAAKARNLELMMKGQELSMRTSKEELERLSGQAAEENKDRRQFLKDSMNEYIRSGQPQSAAGKQSTDEGFIPGTPEHAQRTREIGQNSVDAQMARFNSIADQRKAAQEAREKAFGLRQQTFDAQQQEKQEKDLELTPKEQETVSKLEDANLRRERVIRNLVEARKLSDKAFDGTLPDRAQRAILESFKGKDPKVVATRDLENILGRSAVERLKENLGSQGITDYEQKSMRELEGIGAKSAAERNRIIDRAIEASYVQMKQDQKRIAEVKELKRRQSTKPAASAPEGDK